MGTTWFQSVWRPKSKQRNISQTKYGFPRLCDRISTISLTVGRCYVHLSLKFKRKQAQMSSTREKLRDKASPAFVLHFARSLNIIRLLSKQKSKKNKPRNHVKAVRGRQDEYRRRVETRMNFLLEKRGSPSMELPCLGQDPFILTIWVIEE